MVKLRESDFLFISFVELNFRDVEDRNLMMQIYCTHIAYPNFTTITTFTKWISCTFAYKFHIIREDFSTNNEEKVGFDAFSVEYR